MNLTIPVFVTELKQSNNPAPSVIVRPLFVPRFSETAETLQRALNKLANVLRQYFDQLGGQPRHDEIAEHTFSPVCEEKILKISLKLRDRFIQTRFFFVTFPAFGRKIAFSPNLPEVWFEFKRNEDLQTRAEEVLTAHFREIEKRDGRDAVNVEKLAADDKMFLTTLELFANLPPLFEPKGVNIFSLLGEEEVGDGAEELRRVGRNLDTLFPADLERVLRREKEVGELTKLLDAKDQRPVLVLGQRLVGKTALIHEYIFRKHEKLGGRRTEKEQTWLLAPQRLISGMSYVGQWEQRLLAILKEAAGKKHLLYFDDFLGLFQAGISRDSNLSVAQILKPYIERREVRVVAEMSPEAWRIFQEKDRSFADLFQILRLAEPDEDENLRILLAVRRGLELKHKTRFHLESLPTALDLQRRYVRDAAFPGKSANFLRQLSIKFRDAEINRENVLTEFQAKSGMNVNFLDDRTTLERGEIIEKLAAGIIGQKPAITAAADVITLAKARLNDAARPLGSFLFLGPTGVGKTESAKKIAEYLYGTEEKLVRFDMNEFVSPYDVARLVGTFDQPEGLLTSAIRRQPFGVVLLDEIEKAHPDVFNLLLQVMSDGRLTDSMGRTADFSNAILILTSNLGAREANIKLGFRQAEESDSQVYRQAAEKFFRPEFFNRLDRIIPFERLRREDVEQIARKLIQQVFRRDGLLRRNCKLQIADAALQKVVTEGYLPELGARALKRAIERRLTQPVAVRLAELNPTAPTIITLSLATETDSIIVDLQELRPVAVATSGWLTADFSDVNENLNHLEDALERLETQIAPLKPSGAVTLGESKHESYFLVREHFKRVERMLERAERRHERDENPAVFAASTRRVSKNPPRRLSWRKLDDKILREAFAARDLAAWLKDWTTEAAHFGDNLENYITDIWRETSLLQAVAERAKNSRHLHRRTVILIASRDEQAQTSCEFLRKIYAELFAAELGLKVTEVQSSKFKVQSSKFNGGFLNYELLEIAGIYAADIAQAESGTHLFLNDETGFLNVEVSAFELGKNEILSEKILPENRQNSSAEANVIRLYRQKSEIAANTLDLRSGLIANDILTVREMRAFVLAGLPTPAELDMK